MPAHGYPRANGACAAPTKLRYLPAAPRRSVRLAGVMNRVDWVDRMDRIHRARL